MKRLRADFAKRNNTQEQWYDLREDWGLIEASLAKQYGLRIRQQLDMPWTEFCTLVSGLMSDTPLGQIVSIRAEKDPKVIKEFNSEQRRIHSDWRRRLANNRMVDSAQLAKDMDSLANTFRAMFGKKGVKT